MTPGKPKPAEAKTKPAQANAKYPSPTEKASTPKATAAKAAAGPPAGPVPPLFRKTDWWTFGISTLLVFIGYYFTLAPDLTLEDCGELATGSFYAGVPHPPGYPMWTVYTWCFTRLVPISNIAWRVALSSAVAGALSCGLIALMVSRGSSMIVEGINELKNIEEKWENAICIVSGYVAAMLFGFNGFFWSQAVIVEVYSFSVLSLVLVFCFLLRWLYAPHQKRYLYWAFFIFGVCFTNHQTLIVAAMGIEVLIIVAQPKLGRDLVAGNSLLYLAGLLAKWQGYGTPFDSNPPLYTIFNVIGLASVAASIWLATKTKKLGTEWKTVLICGLLYIVGVCFYLYMPIASMSNPPLNWGYPRTEEGFWHALTRGQYEKANPTSDPLRYVAQLYRLFEGAVEEFNIVYLVIGFVPFLFLRKMQKREKAWFIGLSVTFLCLACLLLYLLNPAPDRQSQQLNRVFFTASHTLVAMTIGYGLTLIAAVLITQYERFRRYLLYGSAAALAVAVYVVTVIYSSDTSLEAQKHFADLTPSENPLERINALFGLGIALASFIIFLFRRPTAPMTAILAVFCVLPVKTVLSHWGENEQRGHYFGYWFGHDMFSPPFKNDKGQWSYDPEERKKLIAAGKPVYPEMDRDTVLYGGTDPGRFNPTYMIFCDSFVPPATRKGPDPEFDRRDVSLITQNALADGTYLNYIRAHYNRSAEYDLPFFQEMLRSAKESSLNYKTNIFAWLGYQLLDRPFLALGDYIEKQRRVGTSWFVGSHFTDLSAFRARLRPGDKQDALSKWLFNNLSKPTQELIAGQGDEKPLRAALVRELNRLLEHELKEPDLAKKDPLYVPERFAGIKLTEYLTRFIQENPQSHTRIRLNRLLLEAAYPKEIAKTKGGVYPDREILTATPEDSQRCFQEYLGDVQRRASMNPPQLRPGEDVKFIEGRVQVSGQVAVMAINALLTKVMFDKNPNNEFYVEESFPLDWMYPHLTPFGIIMKINRQPLPEITQEMVDKDHNFWSLYSERLIGNWITYDTPMSNICAFAEKVYLRGNLKDYKGDPKFVRDDNAQKAFSKLRSSIGGVYAWRVANARTPQDQQRMIKEAEFTFKQAFAYCPYSPEAVFRYVNLLLSLLQTNPSRIEDALLIAKTCQKLDPYNAQVDGLVKELTRIKQQVGDQQAAMALPQNELARLDAAYRAEPANLQKAFDYVSALVRSGQTNMALTVLDRVIASPKVDFNTVVSVADAYSKLQQYGRVEQALQKMVALQPSNPEVWYDLAGVQASFNKTNPALQSLKRALELNTARLATNAKASNLAGMAGTDGRFINLRAVPEFQQLIAPK